MPSPRWSKTKEETKIEDVHNKHKLFIHTIKNGRNRAKFIMWMGRVRRIVKLIYWLNTFSMLSFTSFYFTNFIVFYCIVLYFILSYLHSLRYSNIQSWVIQLFYLLCSFLFILTIRVYKYISWGCGPSNIGFGVMLM